jgi:MraZ protein
VFLGEFEHSLDERGRVAVPAKWRAQLAGGLVVTRGLDRCLFAWPMEEWAAISHRLSQFSLMHADTRRLHRLLFSGAVDSAPDRLGRILLPSFLRDYAGLNDTLSLVGVLNRFEIWNRASWQAERSSAEAQSAELAEQLFTLGV